MRAKFLENRKLAKSYKGFPLPRLYWTKDGKSVTVKCGDCENKIKIYAGGGNIEVGGVIAADKYWLLLFKKLSKIK